MSLSWLFFSGVMMFELSWREIGRMLLLTLLAALVGWPSAVMAQREDESLRSGEKSQGRTLQPPVALRNVATTLRTMGRADLADRLIRDYGTARVRLGEPGSRATTGPPIIVPLVTNRRDNIMTLDKRQLTTQCDTKRTDQNPVTDGTLGWALTVVHEYVHMGQDNPTQTARFENAGWRESVHENQSWMRSVMSKVSDAERMPNSAEKVARLRELSRQLELLRVVHQATINDLKEEIAAGHVGAGQDWPTIEAGTSADLNTVVTSANTLVAANIKNTRDRIARVEREIASGAAADPRPRPAPRGTGAGSASTSTKVVQAGPGTRAQSPFAGKYVGEIRGPASVATWACTVSSDGSFQGWFRHTYSQTTGYEAILNGTVLGDGEVHAAGTAKKFKLSDTFDKSVTTGSFPVSLSGKFAGGAFWGKVVGESELVDATAERVVGPR